MASGEMPRVPEPRPGGRRILVVDHDLYGQVGGGQSAYRSLIAHHPGDVWYYFRDKEAADAPRPANTVSIPTIRPMVLLPDKIAENRLHFLWMWEHARNLAASVVEHLGPTDFDVVDVPDYTQVGPFMRPALGLENCRVGVLALAMHGTISDAFRLGWPTGDQRADRRVLAQLPLREHMQFRAADVRYAISPQYAEAWQRRVNMPIHLFDPLLITGGPAPRPLTREGGPPDLVFVGRREKCKGPDLFIDAAWCLDPDIYRRLLLLGPEGANRLGQGGEGLLWAAARRRGLSDRLEMPGGVSAAAVAERLCDRALLLVPSRYDTFNLTALEAVVQGCPLLVSEKAGVARWLRERLPAIADAIAPIDCARVYAHAASGILGDYDRFRDRMLASIRTAALQPDPGTLDGIYRPTSRIDSRARQVAIELGGEFGHALMDGRTSGPSALSKVVRHGKNAVAEAAKLARRALPVRPVLNLAFRPLPAERRDDANFLVDRLSGVLRAKGPDGYRAAAIAEVSTLLQYRGWLDSKSAGQAIGLARHYVLLERIRTLPERSAAELDAKLRLMTGAVGAHLTDRVSLFRELARLERRAGNALTAATYLLRTMRWVGGDGRGDLPFVTETLRANNFVHEAATAEAMFGGGDTLGRCRALMEDAYRRNLSKPVLPLAVLDDRRDPAARPRAAVIASLYNAADKLPTLLTMLSNQTLAKQGGLEVVLVDSNSPGPDRAAFEAFEAFEAFAAAHPQLPIVFARSAERETIQAAWNRGIRLARAPYLAFLGADEGLHPDALRRLADALDRDSSADWAMADSIVTDVDKAGIYNGDVMAYDRTGYRQDLVYLETCYLSWVGALYRRSIHDRFGYYDESYRAAGDTEFKNRVMPHIKSVHVPAPLGVFNNYPEERTTQHPRAEIEDLRAWYLWRSAAGMDYAFGRRAPEEAWALLQDCYGYRKSYCGHLSTDIDLALALADHLIRRVDAPELSAAAWQEATRAQLLIKSFEMLPEEAMGKTVPGNVRRLWAIAQLREARGMARRQQQRLALPATPAFHVFNDNRYEQHFWSWSVG